MGEGSGPPATPSGSAHNKNMKNTQHVVIEFNSNTFFAFNKGGHINPAVTVAKACLGKFPWKKVPVYILSQYAGAFAASACVYLVYTGELVSY